MRDRFGKKSTDCIIDVRICDVHQPSYSSRNPVNNRKSVENDKKKKCLRHFTPFVVSCEGLPGKEADALLKRLFMNLAKKWDKPYSKTVSFVRIRFAIALVRAKKRCFRGSRIHTNSISQRYDWSNGAGLRFNTVIIFCERF